MFEFLFNLEDDGKHIFIIMVAEETFNSSTEESLWDFHYLSCKSFPKSATNYEAILFYARDGPKMLLGQTKNFEQKRAQPKLKQKASDYKAIWIQNSPQYSSFLWEWRRPNRVL